MSPLEANKAMMDQLEVLAQRDHKRHQTLAQELQAGRGGHAAIVEVLRLIEQHAERLRHPTEVVEGGDGEETRPREMTELELQRLSGVNDAMAYLRAQERSAQQNLLMQVGRLSELEAIQEANREEAKRVAMRINTMLQEVQRGVPHDMVGRPQPEGDVRRDIVSRKADVQRQVRKRAPARKSRG